MEPNRLLGEIATSGREARVKWVQDLVVAFPDGRIAVEQVFAHGDLICAELRFAGTHTGPMHSAGGIVPATHRTVTFPYCLVRRTNGEQIVELHEYFGQTELGAQLGLLAHP